MSITMSGVTWSSTTVDSRSIHDRHTSNTNSAMHVKLSRDSSSSYVEPIVTCWRHLFLSGGFSHIGPFWNIDFSCFFEERRESVDKIGLIDIFYADHDGIFFTFFFFCKFDLRL